MSLSARPANTCELGCQSPDIFPMYGINNVYSDSSLKRYDFVGAETTQRVLLQRQENNIISKQCFLEGQENMEEILQDRGENRK